MASVRQLVFKATGYINTYLNVASAAAALCVVAMILGAMALDRKTMNRVSIRITLAISVLDVGRAVGQILLYRARPVGVGCVAADFAMHWMMLAYLFLNMSIAANLQLIFLAGHGFDPRWERAYWAISFGAATLLALVPPGKQCGVLLTC